MMVVAGRVPFLAPRGGLLAHDGEVGGSAGMTQRMMFVTVEFLHTRFLVFFSLSFTLYFWAEETKAKDDGEGGGIGGRCDRGEGRQRGGEGGGGMRERERKREEEREREKSGMGDEERRNQNKDSRGVRCVLLLLLCVVCVPEVCRVCKSVCAEQRAGLAGAEGHVKEKKEKNALTNSAMLVALLREWETTPFTPACQRLRVAQSLDLHSLVAAATPARHLLRTVKSHRRFNCQLCDNSATSGAFVL
jgi:hypothetical protein